MSVEEGAALPSPLRRLAGKAEMKRNDDGFTLIELLVVMVIIATLAAIAVPAFLSQRAKAYDSATKQDVNAWGKEVGAYFVDGRGTLQTPDASRSPGYVVLTDNASTPYTITVHLSPGTVLASPALVNESDALQWCVALSNPKGSTKTYHYSGATGLGSGSC